MSLSLSLCISFSLSFVCDQTAWESRHPEWRATNPVDLVKNDGLVSLRMFIVKGKVQVAVTK